jgi:stage II sporulation protein D
MGSLKLMRRLLLPVVLLAALVFAANASARTLFVIHGKGWGHGVGMSQYGALGKAQRGVEYRNILGFYYQGTDIGQTERKHVRVLLASGRSFVRISSAESFNVGGKTLAAGSYRVEPAADGDVRVVGEGKFANPADAAPGDASLALNGDRYRGKLRLWIRDGRVAVVNVATLQAYLLSVVPREMPASFAEEALKAQAVAARSYAVRAARASWFDLYPDTRDQVYGGLDHPAPGLGEDPRTTAAVQATAGEVVLFGSEVAQTFFSSSNGGYEAASADTWGGDPGYLNARSDPDDDVAANPNRNWRVLFTGKELGDRLGTPPPTDAVVSSRASGRVRALTLSGSGFSQVVSGTAPLRSPEFWRSSSTLGLKSGRFWVGMQSLRSDKQESRCNRRVRLYVAAHGVGEISLEQRRADRSTWTEISLRKVDSTHWRATRHPCISMDYRVRSARAVGPLIHVKVVVDVAFAELQGADALTGRVNPTLAGSPVAVQRDTASGWLDVARTTVDADGTFRADFAVQEGVYRARVVPPSSAGLAIGFSPVLHVVTG